MDTPHRSVLVRETLLTTLANLAVAVLVNILAWRFQLVSGGLTGYALFLNLITPFSTGTLLLGMNLVLLLIAVVTIGKGPGLRGVYGFVSLSFFIDITRNLLQFQQVATPSFLATLILITLLSIGMGAAISVVLANNYSVGAYSTLYMIVKKWIDVPAQNLFFLLDFVLAILTGIVFGFEKGVLLIVNAVVAYYVVKTMLPKCKAFFGQPSSFLKKIAYNWTSGSVPERLNGQVSKTLGSQGHEGSNPSASATIEKF